MIRLYHAVAPIALIAGQAYAGETVRFEQPGEWVVPADFDKAAATGEGVVLYDRQIRLEDGVVTRYTDVAYLVENTDELQSLGTLQFSWMPDKGDLTIHRLEIIRDGQVIDLVEQGVRPEILRRERELESRSVDGELTAAIAVPGLKVGDILRMTHSTDLLDQALGAEMQAIEGVVTEPTKLGFGRLRMSWPADEEIAYGTMGQIELGPVQQIGDSRVLEIAFPTAEPDEMPEDAPGRYTMAPTVQVGTYADWREVSSAMAPHFAVDGAIAMGSPLAAEVAKIQRAESDPLKRAALALRLVQDEVSYLMNGMEGGNYLPQSPADTWSLRYGDCKAKSVLLLAMLREMGIESEVVLVDTENGDAVSISQPVPGAFNHMIVHATIDGTEYWLDGTSAGTRLATLHEVPNFTWALPLKEAGSGLIPVTQRWPEAPDRVMNVTYDFSNGVDMPMLYEADVTLRGIMGSEMRSVATETEKREIVGYASKYLEDLIGGLVYDAAVTYDEDAGVARLNAKGLAFDKFTFDRNVVTHNIESASTGWTFTPDRARSAWREIPYMVGGPVTLRETGTYRLPNGGRGASIGGVQSLDQQTAGTRFTRTVTLDGAVLEVADSTAYIPMEIAAADIPAEKAAMRSMASGDPVLKFTDPERLWELDDAEIARRTEPYTTAISNLIALDDDEPAFYNLQGHFNVIGRDYESALRSFDRAIDNGGGAEVIGARSQVYALLGDMDAAIDDAQAAFDEKGDLASAAALADMLSRAGRTDEALDLIDTLGLSGDERVNAELTWAEMSGLAGREAEAWDRLETVLADRPTESSVLNSLCWTAATWNYRLDAAEEFCDRAVMLSGNSAATLDSRALLHYRQGRSEDAMADIENALRQAPGQAASLYLRGIIRMNNGEIAAGRKDLVHAKRISPDVERRYAAYGLKPRG